MKRTLPYKQTQMQNLHEQHTYLFIYFYNEIKKPNANNTTCGIPQGSV